MSEHGTDMAQLLRGTGLRATQQRVIIMSILQTATDHPSADELCARARGVDASISLATVYRTLLALEEVGLVHKLALDGEPARYELTPASEHDHLVDIDTGEIIEIPSDRINRLRAEIAGSLGYEIVSQHTLIRARKLDEG